MNAIRRPSGDHTGPPAATQPVIATQPVRGLAPVPSGFIVQMSSCPTGDDDIPRTKPICVPSGDQAGWLSVQPGRQLVSCRTFVPSAFITSIAGRLYGWALATVNAICRPSGDHDGWPTPSGVVADVSR